MVGWNESLWEMWFCFRGFGGLNFMVVKVRVGGLALGLNSLPTDTLQASLYMVDIPGVSYKLRNISPDDLRYVPRCGLTAIFLSSASPSHLHSNTAHRTINSIWTKKISLVAIGAKQLYNTPPRATVWCFDDIVQLLLALRTHTSVTCEFRLVRLYFHEV